MKYDVETIKKEMYSGVLCDVMDGMGYRNQSIARTVMPLKDHTVIFGPAFTSIGTQVYSMPADPLTAQCRWWISWGKGRYTCWSSAAKRTAPCSASCSPPPCWAARVRAF